MKSKLSAAFVAGACVLAVSHANAISVASHRGAITSSVPGAVLFDDFDSVRRGTGLASRLPRSNTDDAGSRYVITCMKAKGYEFLLDENARFRREPKAGYSACFGIPLVANLGCRSP